MRMTEVLAALKLDGTRPGGKLKTNVGGSNERAKKHKNRNL